MATSVRTFNESDWDAFGGAEAWPTEDPLLRQIDDQWVAIADLNGFWVFRCLGDPANRLDYNEDSWHLGGQFTPAMARLILGALPDTMSVKAVEELGFLCVA